jgi:SAM-dependent methyltransferase
MHQEYNLSEYSDPEIYDLENSEFEPDGGFVLDFAKKLKGKVLELGCGTGRITIPLAQAGIDITGVDVVPGMIQRAREKAGSLPIDWVIADIREFHLGRTFKLVFETGSVFQHLLTRADQESYLARVREHLDPDGRFIFSVMLPQAKMLISNDEETDWFTYNDTNGRSIRVSGTDHYDPIRQVKVETAYRRWLGEDGQEVQKIAPLSLRYTFPQEIESLLHYNGFEIEKRYGDWKQNELTGKSSDILQICMKRP